MRLHMCFALALGFVITACDDRKDTKSGEPSASTGAESGQVGKSPGDQLPGAATSRIDCDTVLSPEIRSKYLVGMYRYDVDDRYMSESYTLCNSYHNEELDETIGFTFECGQQSIAQFARIAEAHPAARGKDATFVALPKLGRGAFVLEQGLQVLDDDTACVFTVTASKADEQLKGDALASRVSRLAGAIVGTLTPAAIDTERAKVLTSRDHARRVKVNCKSLYSEAVLAALPGYKAQPHPPRHYPSKGTTCPSLHHRVDPRVEIQVNCYQHEALSIRDVAPSANDHKAVDGFGKRAVSSERGLAVHDDDSACVLRVRVVKGSDALSGSQIAEKKPALINALLATLTPALIE